MKKKHIPIIGVAMWIGDGDLGAISIIIKKIILSFLYWLENGQKIVITAILTIYAKMSEFNGFCQNIFYWYWLNCPSCINKFISWLPITPPHPAPHTCAIYSTKKTTYKFNCFSRHIQNMRSLIKMFCNHIKPFYGNNRWWI